MSDIDEIVTFWREGHIVVEVTVRARASEIAELSPQQAEAFMLGLARCLSLGSGHSESAALDDLARLRTEGKK